MADLTTPAKLAAIIPDYVKRLADQASQGMKSLPSETAKEEAKRFRQDGNGTNDIPLTEAEAIKLNDIQTLRNQLENTEQAATLAFLAEIAPNRTKLEAELKARGADEAMSKKLLNIQEKIDTQNSILANAAKDAPLSAPDQKQITAWLKEYKDAFKDGDEKLSPIVLAEIEYSENTLKEVQANKGKLSDEAKQLITRVGGFSISNLRDTSPALSQTFVGNLQAIPKIIEDDAVALEKNNMLQTFIGSTTSGNLSDKITVSKIDANDIFIEVVARDRHSPLKVSYDGKKHTLSLPADKRTSENFDPRATLSQFSAHPNPQDDQIINTKLQPVDGKAPIIIEGTPQVPGMNIRAADGQTVDIRGITITGNADIVMDKNTKATLRLSTDSQTVRIPASAIQADKMDADNIENSRLNTTLTRSEDNLSMSHSTRVRSIINIPTTRGKIYWTEEKITLAETNVPLTYKSPFGDDKSSYDHTRKTNAELKKMVTGKINDPTIDKSLPSGNKVLILVSDSGQHEIPISLIKDNKVQFPTGEELQKRIIDAQKELAAKDKASELAPKAPLSTGAKAHVEQLGR